MMTRIGVLPTSSSMTFCIVQDLYYLSVYKKTRRLCHARKAKHSNAILIEHCHSESNLEWFSNFE